MNVPRHLAEYARLYETDPRAAAIEWFRGAKYGLFLHYGLYTLLGRHEWVQYKERIPVAEYEKLAKLVRDSLNMNLIYAIARLKRGESKRGEASLTKNLPPLP